MRAPRPSLSLVAAAFLGSCAGVPAAGPTVPGSYGATWDDGRAEVAAHAGTQSVYGEPRATEEFLITVTEEQDGTALVKALPGVPARSKRGVLKLNRERTVPTGIYTYRQFSSTFVDRDSLELTKIAMSSQEWCGTTFVEATVREGLMTLRTFSYFEGEGDRDFELAWPEGTWAVDALPLLVRALPAGAAGSSELLLLPSLLSNRVAEPRLVPAKVTWSAPEEGRREVLVTAEGLGEHRLVLEAEGERRLLSWREPDGDELRLLSSQRLAYWRLNAPGQEALRESLLAPDPGSGR